MAFLIVVFSIWIILMAFAVQLLFCFMVKTPFLKWIPFYLACFLIFKYLFIGFWVIVGVFIAIFVFNLPRIKDLEKAFDSAQFAFSLGLKEYETESPNGDKIKFEKNIDNTVNLYTIRKITLPLFSFSKSYTFKNVEIKKEFNK